MTKDRVRKLEIMATNLNFDTTDEAFKTFFEKIGSVTKAKLIYRNGAATGKGFVEYHDEASANKAMETL